jgi:hypothetical protein
MLRLPFARRGLVAAGASAVVLFFAVLVPSTAWAEAPNPSACKGLYHGNPPGSLAITTNPPSGTVLHPGDEVEVTATWNTGDWPTPVLHKVLDCLLVNGDVDYDHSIQEKPTDNDGLFRYRFTVPNGARGRICDRVRLSGRFVDGGDLVVQKSNAVCFSIAAVAAGGTGTPGAPVDTTTQAATPADQGAPAPLVPAEPAPPAPEVMAAPPLELSAVSIPTLPRTGADPLPLLRVGALLVLLGGVALVARAGLPRPSARESTLGA